MRSSVLLICASLVMSLAARPSGAQPAKPSLVVVLVVDQMRRDYIQDYGPKWTKGLRRLVDQGAWFTKRRLSVHDDADVRRATRPSAPARCRRRTASSATSGGIAPHSRPCRAPATAARAKCRTARGKPVQRRQRADAPGAELAVGHRQVRRPRGRRCRSSARRRRCWPARDAATRCCGSRAAAGVRRRPGRRRRRSRCCARPSARPSRPISGSSGNGPRRSPTTNSTTRAWARSRPDEWDAEMPHALKPRDGKPSDVLLQRRGRKVRTPTPPSDGWPSAAIDGMKLGQGRHDGLPRRQLLGARPRGPRLRSAQPRGPGRAAAPRRCGRQAARPARQARRTRQVRRSPSRADHGVAVIPEQAAADGLDAGRIKMAEIIALVDKVTSEKLGAGRWVAIEAYSEFYFRGPVFERDRRRSRAAGGHQAGDSARCRASRACTTARKCRRLADQRRPAGAGGCRGLLSRPQRRPDHRPQAATGSSSPTTRRSSPATPRPTARATPTTPRCRSSCSGRASRPGSTRRRPRPPTSRRRWRSWPASRCRRLPGGPSTRRSRSEMAHGLRTPGLDAGAADSAGPCGDLRRPGPAGRAARRGPRGGQHHARRRSEPGPALPSRHRGRWPPGRLRRARKA